MYEIRVAVHLFVELFLNSWGQFVGGCLLYNNHICSVVFNIVLFICRAVKQLISLIVLIAQFFKITH